GLMLENSIPPEELLVIIDDINLPAGKIRIRACGSNGNKNKTAGLLGLSLRSLRYRIEKLEIEK
ncbi:MAG: aminoacyl-tRNA hydrolase, partial [Proteobacteria bacterium]|nr:aminoacyl-tRNA hydrolase [Pseudomonadota bacterium]